ncbi:MAG: hypothetical protein V7655_00975 [Aequorivita antarctica]
MKNILIILAIVFCNILWTQNLNFKDLKIEEFYTIEETKNGTIKNIGEIETFLDKEVNADFSNINDLNFLKNISKENKIVMIGETHYSQSISNFRNRIFFALNTYDYYPLIIVENSYSITEYSNYYIHIKNDELANSFLQNELSNFLYTEDDLIFLNKLREWNKNNPIKQLSIGGSDLEFTYENIMGKILKPYFYKLTNVDKAKIDEVIELGKKQSNDFFIEIKPYLSKAKDENLTGDYPFITPQYISNIITNYSSTNNAFRYSFGYYRQNSIIRNITDDSFFGNILKNYKILIYGGGEHMKNHFNYPDNANFFSEGSYFNNDYELTKNKTYSIMLDCLAYSYGEMKNRNLEDCVPQGNQYNSMIKIFQKGFENELITEQKPYFIYEKKNEILKFISQFYYKNELLSLTKDQWNRIKSLNYQKDDETINSFIKLKDKNFDNYDKYIFVPASEIVTARLKK